MAESNFMYLIRRAFYGAILLTSNATYTNEFITKTTNFYIDAVCTPGTFVVEEPYTEREITLLQEQNKTLSQCIALYNTHSQTQAAFTDHLKGSLSEKQDSLTSLQETTQILQNASRVLTHTICTLCFALAGITIILVQFSTITSYSI